MSVGAITAGEAYVSITCDNSELVAGLRESSATIQATARNVATMEDALIVNVGVEGVGALESALTRIEGAVKRTGAETVAAFAVAAEAAGSAFQKVKTAVLNAATAFGEFGDSFDKMAGRTGISTETLSEYAHAAAMCGADISNVEGALKGMSRYLDDAATKGGDAKAARRPAWTVGDGTFDRVAGTAIRNDRGGDRANRRTDGARGARDENLRRRRPKTLAAFQFRRGRAPSDEGGGAGARRFALRRSGGGGRGVRRRDDAASNGGSWRGARVCGTFRSGVDKHCERAVESYF